jgi:hypothetical protein
VRHRAAVVGACAIALAGVAVAGAWPAAAQGESLPAVFEARAEAGAIHDSVAVPAYFETFFPYSLSEASNGSSHGYHAVFYPGFFLTAAAEQQGFPAPPGTTETLYPQGPTTASAAAVPAQPQGFGRSQSTSAADGASGSATAGGGDIAPLGHIGFAQTTSAVKAAADAVRSNAIVVLHDLTIGSLRIGTVTAAASAVSTGQPGGATTSGSVQLADMSVAGVPVQLTPDGVVVAGSPAGLPGLEPVDQALAQAGITIARQPDRRTVAPDGGEARVQLGGVTVTLHRPEREFTATFTLGRLDLLARDQSVAPVAVSVPLPAPPIDQFVSAVPGAVLGSTTAAPAVAPSAAAVPAPPGRGLVTEDVRSTTPVRGGDYSAIAAVVAIATALALFTRRIIAALTV